MIQKTPGGEGGVKGVLHRIWIDICFCIGVIIGTAIKIAMRVYAKIAGLY